MVHIAGTPVLPLLYTVFQSIFQVFLLCLTGYYLAWRGIADKRIQRALNNINISLFTPALLFSKVAFFLTLEKLRELWVIPLFFLLISGLSGIIANAFAHVCRLKRSQRNFAIAASMFMNSNSLPVALMQSLVATVPGLKWTPDDDQDAMFGRALTYLVVFSTLGMMLRWSYGVQLLSQADTEESEVIRHGVSAHADVSDTNQIWLSSSTRDTGEPRRSGQNTLHAQLYARYRPHRHHDTHVPPAGFGEELSDSSPFHTPSDSELETDSDETLITRVPRRSSHLSDAAHSSPLHVSAVGAQTRPTTAMRQFPSHRTITLSHSLSILIRRLRTRRIRIPTPPPPLFASLLALLFTLPPLQAILNSKAMVPVKGALDGAGACSVPLTLIVLGGWFWEDNGKEGKDAKRGHRSGAGDGIKTENAERSSGVPSGDEDEPEQDGIEPETGGSHEARRRQVLTCESVESLAARDCAQGETPYGGGRQDIRRVSRSPSLSSLFSVLQDIWKMTPVGGRRRRKGPVHLADDDDEQYRDADIEAGDNAIWRTCSSTSIKGKQTDGRMDVDEDTAKQRQRIRPAPPGETTTVAVTLLSRMILTPLLLLPLMAFVKIRSDGEGGIKVFDDPVFIVATILLVASPPALTLAQISQRAAAESKPKLKVPPATAPSTSAAPSQIPVSTPFTESAPVPSARLAAVPVQAPVSPPASSPDANSPFERLLSRTVFWAYCVLTPPVTIVCVLVGMVFMSL
ncbi:membrane transport protein-domain-containing protein [Pisolithus croceorrhizus]|nr:membrane transport protein-domain-containing protein [Pisolithus croceorrhizus]KAI6149094.1 membrane transport protein-domain-containing protein [Pisolithus thermaeus]